MNEVITLSLVFLIGMVASFVGSMVGGGGLISIPLLIFLGLPSHVAIATNRLGSFGLIVGAGSKYFRERKIQWTFIIPLSIAALAGGFVGARLLIHTDESILLKAVAVMLLLTLPVFFLRRNLGIARTETSKFQRVVGYVLYFLFMIWGGFFGGGTAIFAFFVLMYSFGLTIVEASATNKVPALLLSILVFFIFIDADLVHFKYGLVLLAGMLIGGYLGAHTAIKKGDAWVKRVFAVIVVASAVKLLFF